MTVVLDALEAVMYGLGVAAILFGGYGIARKSNWSDPSLIAVGCVCVGIGVGLCAGAFFIHSP